MGHTLLGVFGLFSLNILLYCGHAQDALLRIEPNWSTLFSGEEVTFICDSREGNDTDWNYSFRRNGTSFINKTSENRYKYKSLSKKDSGEYQCVTHQKIHHVGRKESNNVSLTVADAPQPVLTVSPSWTRPGDSVTLTCSVEPPSAGWRFFWYKAVHRRSLNYYTYELLPGSTTGAEQQSYVLHGQTHTAGYVCRAARGAPVFYTLYSGLKFVWSTGVNPAASLTVSPHRLQHFSTESLSLSCEGTSAEWRVMMADEDGTALSCSNWGTMTGSTCNTDTRATCGKYWCESETQSSNAANITITPSAHVILVSPVHPVTEGHSVTLGCKLRTEILENVDFYKNDQLISNAGTGELFIAAVNKSDDGFYKCSGRKSPDGSETLTSAASWLSVTYPEEAARSSVFPVLLVVGLVSGVLLIVLLLLFLCRYRKSKGSGLSRTNQSAATDHMLNQDATQDKQHSSLLPDESSLTYSVVQLKNHKKKGKLDEADESPVYSDVRIASAAGKSRCVAEEETVYSSIQINEDIRVDQTGQHEKQPP
ncbi:uncharacterized protein AB9W97_018937 [Spinachia spinachia]